MANLGCVIMVQCLGLFLLLATQPMTTSANMMPAAVVDVTDTATAVPDTTTDEVITFVPTTEIDECASNPCVNGICNDLKNEYQCDCTGTGYEGTNCEIDIDECTLGTDTCDVNANCTNINGSYTCTCVDGYSGDGYNCTEIDECASNPCVNGICNDLINGYECNCTETGYEGVNCDVDIDECTLGTDTCDVNANCTNINGSYTCTCLDGYNGDGFTCTEIDECASNPCVNGICNDLINGYECNCTDTGYEGVNCDVDIDECTLGTDTCDVNANCTNINGSYTCTCLDGYNGDGYNCTDIDECASNPCVNGICNDLINGYECNCTETGYEGVNCDVDIDECALGTDTCDVNANCTNIDGSYNCACLDGYNGDGFTCTEVDECASNPCVNSICNDLINGYECNCTDTGYEGVNCDVDINECTLGTDTCDVNANCTNINGSYTCTCLDGYNGDGYNCTDIDECASNPCVNGICNDLINGYECNCTETGYEGVNCDVDIDECTLGTDTCDVNANCTNINGSYTCTCLDGYNGDGYICIEIDECASNPCVNGVCNDLINGYECNCTETGYRGVNCDVDIDECTLGTDACDVNANCTNINGSYTCTCVDGYSGDGFICTDIDECASNPCLNGICNDLINGYECNCTETGYEGVNCDVDIDECALGTDTCDVNANCTNINGSYNCACLDGYNGDGFTCTEVDECASNPCVNSICNDLINGYECNCTDTGYEGVNCDVDINECTLGTDTCDVNANCTNINGSYTCTCLDGYNGDGYNCTDIDECASNPCVNGICNDLINGYECNCTETGYEGVNCDVDIDECTLGTDTCDVNANCTNINGSYTCTCLDGYNGDGYICIEIDECASNPCVNGVCNDLINGYECNCTETGYRGVNCDVDIDECTLGTDACDVNANCTNINGSYTCTCVDGYSGDGFICTDIDECASNPCLNGICNDLINGYECNCTETGYEGVNCDVDIDECTLETDTCDVNANCTNINGSYNCTCLDGYNGDGFTCTEIEECVSNPCVNGICNDLINGYECNCTETGYEGVNCDVDIDECTLGTDTCDVNANCTNINGSYNCTCLDGYNGDGFTCKDIDECTLGTDTCDVNAYCTNINGSYNCTCLDGYNGDGFTCTDIDECTLGTDTCDVNANCTNINGSYTCTCLDGYYGDGYICTDIDECALETDACDVNATCTNTDGSYNCTCLDGYYGDGFNCTEIDECDSNPCLNDGVCNDLINGYECNCTGTGYNGINCEKDIDECALETDACDVNATCTNTDGSYNCTCLDGYYGDGFNCTEIDECASNPCVNGMCNDLINGYECDCTETGYEGVNCEIDIDECESMTDNCDDNANCTNTNGSFVCSCNPGFEGNGINCTQCTSDKYGTQCNETCTCVGGADCNDVNGYCSCNATFAGQECNRVDLNVSISEIPDEILDGSNITLVCTVNLPANDIGSIVTWTLPDGSTREVNFDGMEDGKYDLHLTNLQPDTDTGDYTCTATTSVQTGYELEVWDTVSIDVKAPGRIITAPGEVSAELEEIVEFNCTVYGNTAPVIMWYGNNGQLLEDTPDKIVINETLNTPLYKTSILQILNIDREDNGTYVCNATNTLIQNAYNVAFDENEYLLLVIERPEIAIDTVTAISAEEIQVEWSVTFAGNLDVDFCTIGYTQTPGGTRMTEDTDGSRTMYTIIGLKPYTNYTIDVTCQNLVGPSDISEFGMPVRTKQSAPGIPNNVDLGEPMPYSVSVSWEDPDELNGPIAFFRVEIEGGSEGPIINETTGKQSSLIVNGLVPGTTYTVFVSAANVEDGIELAGERTQGEQYTTKETEPSPPTDVTAEDERDECTISWSVPDKPNGLILNYIIQYSVIGRGESGGEPSTGSDTVGGNMYTKTYNEVEDLIAYSEYTFTLVGVTSAGEGLPSEEVTCLTEPGAPEEEIVPPAPVDQEEPQRVTSNTFKMTVAPADTRNGPIGCYEIVVVPLEKDAEIPTGNPDVAYPPSSVTDYQTSKARPGFPYTAMVITGSELAEDTIITIGNKSLTTCNDKNAYPSIKNTAPVDGNREAENGRLQSSTRYTVFTRTYVPILNGDTVEFSSSPYMNPAVDTNAPPGPNVGAIVGSIMGVLVAVVLVLLVLVYYRRTKTDQEQTNIIDYNENGGMEMPPVNRGFEDDVAPIPIDQLEATFIHKSANNNAILQAEYRSIPESTGEVTKEASQSEVNKDKNRYINIIAFDQTRVRLHEREDEPGSDYINACYVDGYNHPAKFIAAQGPRVDTINDFWRMIWEQNSTTIVMLTKCVELGRDKCAQYWPDEASVTCDDLIITLEDSITCSDYVIRKFSIAERGDEEGLHARSLTQFHYLAWPDHGSPDYPYNLLAFLKRVRQMTYAKTGKGNIVVHCSAGVGRTGTYILIDTMIEMIAKEKQVDIYNVIYKLRNQRNLLVQSFVQYLFIHKALVELYKFGHTEVDLMNLTSYYLKLTKPDPETQKSGVDMEYKMVASQQVIDTRQDFGNKEVNKEKNRLRQVVPYEHNRVKLERLVGIEHSGYINASFINGYEHDRAYIATQGPLPNTVSDFWRMVFEMQSSTIVMLCKVTEKGQEVCNQYWPAEGNSATQSYLAIQNVNEEDQGEYIVRDFQLTNTKGGGLRKIRQYHFQEWPEVGMPESGVSLIKLIGEAHKHQKTISNYPIVVHGSSGAGRTGVFCALSILLERIQAEGVVDVFHTVRTLRQQRPHMVQDPTQYQFCYKAILNHLDSYGTYANYR